MYKTFLHVHVAVSSLFVIVALILSLNAVASIVLKKKYKRFHKRLEFVFLILLYISFFQGIGLFFLLQSGYNNEITTFAAASENEASRFWAVEHSAIMIFALILSQIGMFFTSQKISDTRKHKYAAFYYGTATAVVLTSLSLFVFDKFGAT